MATLEMTIKELHPWNEIQCEMFHYAVVLAGSEDIEWHDGATPLNDLPLGLWFRVNRVNNDVRVVLEDDPEAHIDGQTYRMMLQLSDHEPNAAVTLAGLLMNTVIEEFQPMDMIAQLEPSEDRAPNH